jgi:hypothetical protein
VAGDVAFEVVIEAAISLLSVINREVIHRAIRHGGGLVAFGLGFGGRPILCIGLGRSREVRHPIQAERQQQG